MPTYSYRCDSCGHRFEAFQRFADDPLRECPECGSPIRRVIQPVGVVFKGSGWYVNDSRPTPKDEAKKGDDTSDGAKKADDKGAGAKDGAKQDEAKPAVATADKATAAPKTPASTPAAD